MVRSYLATLRHLLWINRSWQVRAIYDYQAQGPDELGLQEGQLIELTDGPSGGRNYADGWWEGKLVAP